MRLASASRSEQPQVWQLTLAWSPQPALTRTASPEPGPPELARRARAELFEAAVAAWPPELPPRDPERASRPAPARSKRSESPAWARELARQAWAGSFRPPNGRPRHAFSRTRPCTRRARRPIPAPRARGRRGFQDDVDAKQPRANYRGPCSSRKNRVVRHAGGVRVVVETSRKCDRGKPPGSRVPTAQTPVRLR